MLEANLTKPRPPASIESEAAAGFPFSGQAQNTRAGPDGSELCCPVEQAERAAIQAESTAWKVEQAERAAIRAESTAWELGIVEANRRHLAEHPPPPEAVRLETHAERLQRARWAGQDERRRDIAKDLARFGPASLSKAWEDASSALEFADEWISLREKSGPGGQHADPVDPDRIDALVRHIRETRAKARLCGVASLGTTVQNGSADRSPSVLGHNSTSSPKNAHRDPGTTSYHPSSWLGQFEGATLAHRLEAAKKHVAVADQAEGVARVAHLAGLEAHELRLRLKDPTTGTRYLRPRFFPLPLKDAKRTAAKWHMGRARGSRRRFEYHQNCGRGVVAVRCSGGTRDRFERNQGQLVRTQKAERCAYSKAVPAGCGSKRTCIPCRKRTSQSRKARVAKAFTEHMARAKRRGLEERTRTGGRFSQKFVTLTSPHVFRRVPLVGDRAAIEKAERAETAFQRVQIMKAAFRYCLRPWNRWAKDPGLSDVFIARLERRAERAALDKSVEFTRAIWKHAAELARSPGLTRLQREAARGTARNARSDHREAVAKSRMHAWVSGCANAHERPKIKARRSISEEYWEREKERRIRRRDARRLEKARASEYFTALRTCVRLPLDSADQEEIARAELAATREWRRHSKERLDAAFESRVELEEELAHQRAREAVRGHPVADAFGFDQLAWWRGFEWTGGSDGLGHPHLHLWAYCPFLPAKLVRAWWRKALAAAGVRENEQPATVIEITEIKIRATRTPIAELVKGARSIRHVFTGLKVEKAGLSPEEAAKQVAQYIEGWAVSEFDTNGRRVLPEVAGAMYAALEGYRQSQASMGLLALGDRACACPMCGTERALESRVYPYFHPHLAEVRQSLGMLEPREVDDSEFAGPPVVRPPSLRKADLDLNFGSDYDRRKIA